MALYMLSKVCFVAIMATMLSLLARTRTTNAFFQDTGPYKPADQQSAVIKLYSHVFTGPNATALTLPPPPGLGANLPNTSSNFFGTITIQDAPVTVEGNSSSTEIGRARGFYVFDSLEQGPVGQTAVEYVWTMVFNDNSGFGGSTLTFKGTDHLLDPQREIAVVGGTGVFRMARGWATFTTFSIFFFPDGTGHAVLAWEIYAYYGV